MKLALVVTTAFAAALAGPALAGPAEDIIAKEGCKKCHTATTTKKGPSWASVATKYKGNAGAADKLFTELKAGGKVGAETEHGKVPGSDADIKAIVQIVLNSK